MKYFKNLKVKILILMLVFILIPLPASAFVRRARAKTTQEIKKVADPMLDNILDGFKMDDYPKYSRDFAEQLKIIGSRTKFFKVNRHMETSLGNYLYRDYMGCLHRGNTTIVLWKGKFDKTDSDVLMKLVIKRQGSIYVVTGLWLQ